MGLTRRAELLQRVRELQARVQAHGMHANNRPEPTGSGAGLELPRPDLKGSGAEQQRRAGAPRAKCTARKQQLQATRPRPSMAPELLQQVKKRPTPPSYVKVEVIEDSDDDVAQAGRGVQQAAVPSVAEPLATNVGEANTAGHLATNVGEANAAGHLAMNAVQADTAEHLAMNGVQADTAEPLAMVVLEDTQDPAGAAVPVLTGTQDTDKTLHQLLTEVDASDSSQGLGSVGTPTSSSTTAPAPAPAPAPQPRLEPGVLRQLDEARRMADLEPNVRSMAQMRLHRAKGRLTEEATERYAAAARDRTGAAQLVFLREWAHGRIPDVDVTASQGVTDVMTQEEASMTGWLNWNELMHALGGWSSKEQRRYVDSVWKTSKKTRPHPGGPTLGAQRKVWISTLEVQRRLREVRTGVDLTGLLPPESLERLLEALQRPCPPAAGEADLQQQKKRPEVGGDDSEPAAPSHEKVLTRAELLTECYKLSQRLLGARDAANCRATGPFAHVAKELVVTQLQKLAQQREVLEGTPVLTPEAAKAAMELVKETAKVVLQVRAVLG